MEISAPSGQMLLLMETLYNITVYAVQNKNYAVIDKRAYY